MTAMVQARPHGGTPPGKQQIGVVSPDKTAPLTPPHSPGRGVTDESEVYGSTMPAAVARAGRGGTGGLSPPMGAPTPPPVVTSTDKNDIVAGAKPSKGRKDAKQLLRVDRILCRAPSHESNISDLSASLSPGNPRVKAANDPNFVSPDRGERDNIMLSILNECGVYESVTDLINDAGLGSVAGSNPVPVSPSDGASGTSGANSKSTGLLYNAKKKKYETPAVWGVAPDDDEESTGPETSSGSKAGSPGADGSKADNSVEYDNVELVLDESALVPSVSNDKADAPAGGKGLSLFGREGSGASGRRTPSGILRNKLTKSRSKTASPATVPTNVSGGMGVAVVESKSDPRISHMYDIARFENEELRPSLGVEGAPDATGGPPGRSRGASPTSMASGASGGAASQAAAPVSPGVGEAEKAAPSSKGDEQEKKGKRAGLLKGLSIKPKGAKSPKASAKKPAKGTANDATAAAVATLPSTPKPTAQNIEDAKRWKATLDQASGKHYYYHRDTKEVSWEKPLGFDEAMLDKLASKGTSADSKGADSGKKAGTVAASKDTKAKSKRGLNVSALGRKSSKSKAEKEAVVEGAAKAAVASVAVAAATAAVETGSNEEAKYWRATQDPNTGKTYYYNKKTKEVSWTMPFGFVDGSGKKAAVEETAAMASVADKRKKTWFKKVRSGDSKAHAKAGDIATEEKGENNAITTGEVDEFAKYWRATQDPTTGKTYYFNKKTKLVQWTKPEGFVEKEKGDKKQKESGDEDAAKEEAKTTAPSPVHTADSGTEMTGEDGAEADNQSDMEAFSDAEAVDKPAPAAARDDDAPFDEPDAPFDEPFDEPKTGAKIASPKRAHFGPPTPRDDDDREEQEDSFDESDKMGAAEPLYGRVKSLKSIDFDGSRQRTFTSHMTDTTRKAANTGGGDAGSAFMNNSSIASEIFTPFDGGDGPAKGQHNDRRPPQQGKQEMVSHRLRERLPQTPPRSSSRNNRRYNGKQAENLGDSSIEEESFEEMEKEYWSGDDVSALSGIGNDSIESRKKKKLRDRDSGREKRRDQRDSRAEKSSSRRKDSRKEEPHGKPVSDDIKEWTQEELDSFIAKNDWQSVSKYINEMRVSKGQQDRLASKKDEPSIREIQDRIEYNRRAQSNSSQPSSKFGTRSQMQMSEESESVWQSLSSASYDDEVSKSDAESSYDRRRRGSSGRRRSSPREMML